MTPPPVPILDPRIGDWIFDATTLVSCAQEPMAGVLAFHFQGRAHLVQEVLREIDRGSAGPLFRRIQWFREEVLSLEDELDEYAQLRRRWGSAPEADRGEAASIVLARRNSWILVTDDGTGYHTARRIGICVTRTPQLIVAMVRAGWMTPDDGWAALSQMVARGRRFGDLNCPIRTSARSARLQDSTLVSRR